MILQNLTKRELIKPPKWLPDNTAYLTIMGSNAYGVSEDNSDVDLYGFCLPPKETLLPHLGGHIHGFKEPFPEFDQWQIHHINDKEHRKEYDIAVFSIVKYFNLLMDNNPNIIDSIFTPIRCISHITPVGQMVRDKRDMFVSKRVWAKFKGYSYSQLHKMNIKNQDVKELKQLNSMFNGDVNEISKLHALWENDPSSVNSEIAMLFKAVHEMGRKRLVGILRHGYDVKFAYHIVRLMDEADQLLRAGEVDLERSREQLKAIRRGEVTQADIIDYFHSKEKALEAVYDNSPLPDTPDVMKIKQLLLDCIEEHYGTLSQAISVGTDVDQMVRELDGILTKYRKE